MAIDLTVAEVQVAILVGGLGTRLRDVIGERLPKPMVEVAGRPFLEHLLLQLAHQGFERVCLLSGHGSRAIRSHFGDGHLWGLRVSYSEEAAPLGTGGALRNALPLLEGTRFLVMNGDSFLDASFSQLIDAHREARTDGARATIALVRIDDVGRYGSVVIDPSGAIRSFREKDEQGGPGLVSTGVYVVERSLVAEIPADRAVSLERETWTAHLDGRLRGHVMDGPFTDIGVPETLARLRSDPAPLLAAAGGRA